MEEIKDRYHVYDCSMRDNGSYKIYIIAKTIRAAIEKYKSVTGYDPQNIYDISDDMDVYINE